MKKIFNTLSISHKLAAVFIFILFMMGIGGSVGLYNAGQLAKVTESLYMDSFKRGETLSSVENEFLSARQETFLHSIINDAGSESYLEGSMEEHKSKIERLLGEYKKMGVAKGQEQLYIDLHANLLKYWTIQSQIVTLSRNGERDSALGLMRMDGNRSFTDTLEALKKLLKHERDTAFDEYQKSGFFASVIITVTLAFSLLAIVVVGGLWLALTRLIVKPIVSIEDSAKKIAQGDFKHRVPVMTEDEIGDLAIEFNRMAESLENYYATLEKKVEERTEELRVANEELSKKKQELELTNMELLEANKMKSQFLANVSHELRTPLNSIIGFSELLQEKTFGELNDRQIQYVEYVHSSGGHLLQLINNILDLSRIEAGRMELKPEDFPVTEVLGEVLSIIRPLAHKRNITIESKTVPASPKLRADKAKFKQIMMNLLSNAVKFNMDGGKITVDWDIMEEPSGMKMERFLVFRVRDTGIGIKEEDRERLFKEFEQIDSSITREYGGTGLGLVITKRLVELHKGSIWLESVPDRGSVFYVKLPQGTEEIDLPVFSSAVSTPAFQESRQLVLILSESPDINHLLEIYLAGGPYDVFTASDGFDLLRKAHEQKPFVIIMGIAIPKKDGWEVLKELKSNAETDDIPVVIISSTDNKELGYAFGAIEYLEKPINKEGLLNALERLKNPVKISKGRRILLIDEEAEALENEEEFLRQEGFSVFKARAVEEAIATARRMRPDLIILRTKLNGRGSRVLELINDLNAVAAQRKIRVIIFTSDELTNEIKKSFGDNVKTVRYKGGLLNDAIRAEIKLAQAI